MKLIKTDFRNIYVFLDKVVAFIPRITVNGDTLSMSICLDTVNNEFIPLTCLYDIDISTLNDQEVRHLETIAHIKTNIMVSDITTQYLTFCKTNNTLFSPKLHFIDLLEADIKHKINERVN